MGALHLNEIPDLNILRPMHFIRKPRYFPLIAYEKALLKMTERLKQVDGLIAIYQIGGLSTPGVSDIDILVVFEEVSSNDPDLPLNTSIILFSRLLKISFGTS